MPDNAVILPENPSWERARRLLHGIRRGAEDVVRLGVELAALRRQWFAQGQGGGPQTSPQVAAKFPDLVRGWQRKVREELGISDDTARRIIERADAIISLRRIASGERVEFRCPGKAEPVSVEPTTYSQSLAVRMLEQVEAGCLSPARAIVGIIGESARRADGLPGRAPTDHGRNLKLAIAKLRTSLPHFNQLAPSERAEIEVLWADLLDLLPPTMLEAIVRQRGRPRR